MNHKSLASTLATLALTGVLAAPALAQNVAVVNGKPVPKARIDMLAEQMARAGRPVSAEMQKHLKDEVIMREVFMQEAKRRGLEGSQDYRDQMTLARESILIRALLADYQKNNPVTDAEAKAEYDKVVVANAGKEYHARHILVETEDQAKALIAQIKQGGSFEELAKQKSKDPGSGAQGGDLGWSNPAGYVPEFSEAMLKLGKGQMSDAPVKSQFGYHIIRVEDVREAQLPKFEEVKPQIVQQLQQQKLAKYQEDLRAKAKIE